MEIAGRRVGTDSPTYVIAEISANHKQRLDTALALVRAAADVGADAVKVQTYRPDTITIDCDRPEFRIGAGTVWDGRTLFDLYSEAFMPWEWHEPLMSCAADLGLHFFSSPFDPSAVEMLARLGVPALKIASFELVDIGLIEAAAKTGKPLIISTGMSTLDEITEAVDAARSAEAAGIALLKCTSAYPARPSDANLRTIPDLARRFGLPVGLSDHTLGAGVAIAAVTVGAVIVEKHLTLSRNEGGPDAAFSTEPPEFKRMVSEIRSAEVAVGAVAYEPTDLEVESRILRRSLFVVEDMRQGEPFTSSNLRSIRPGHGLHTRYLPTLLGRMAATDVRRGTPMSWDLVAPINDS